MSSVPDWIVRRRKEVASMSDEQIDELVRVRDVSLDPDCLIAPDFIERWREQASGTGEVQRISFSKTVENTSELNTSDLIEQGPTIVDPPDCSSVAPERPSSDLQSVYDILNRLAAWLSEDVDPGRTRLMALGPSTSTRGRNSLNPTGCRPFRILTLPRRELDFPADYSLGMLCLRGPGRRTTSSRARHGWAAGWREYVEARGRVLIPAGTQVQLRAMHPWPDPNALERLGPMDLQALVLGGLAASEDVLASLGHLTGLDHLDLWAAPVGDEAISFIARLSNLKALSLWGTKVTDAGLDALNPLVDLRSLTVPRRIGDAAMPYLAKLDGLRELDLSGSRVTNAGLAFLSGARSLRRLSLWDTPITDAGLRHLRELPSLIDLDLGATAITDHGLAELAGLRLRRLSLRDSFVSLGGLQILSAALPGCRVERAETDLCLVARGAKMEMSGVSWYRGCWHR